MGFFDEEVAPNLHWTPMDHKIEDPPGEGFVWTTLEGKRMKLEEMDLDHLINCRNLCKRRGEAPESGKGSIKIMNLFNQEIGRRTENDYSDDFNEV